MRGRLAWGAVLFGVAACSGAGSGASAPGVSPPAGGEVDASVPGTVNEDAGATDAPSSSSTCSVGTAVCAGYASVHRCVADPGGARWVDETCAAGSGCVKGACVPGACSDECLAGETSGGKTCALRDVKSGSWTTLDPTASLHDRARDYLPRLRRDSLATGGLGNVRYADPPTYSQISFLDDTGDSALWTGSYLASEALRLHATGALDARREVRELVKTLHTWLGVTGSPGVLARFAIESSKKPSYPIGDLDCSQERVHCGVAYGGKTYDYIGHVSRDQYQGVVLGLELAYEALTEADEDLRETIRGDLVTLVEELMKERQVPLRLRLNGTQLPQSTVNARFIVVHDAELVNGALDLRVDTNNTGDSEMYGFQEFAPDLADLVREIPGFAWVPSIARPSSAVMLASFFQVALRVTDGVPAYKTRRDAILSYYVGHQGKGGNVNDWLNIAKGWTPGTGCGGNYYANNITMMPMYDLARLESDSTRRDIVENQILDAKMWPAFRDTKNTFFSFIYASVKTGAPPGVVTSALAQLSQFPKAPRVHAPVDLRNDPKYPSRDGQCADHVAHADAVDVGDRPADGFLWQRIPWLLYDPGNAADTFPGEDYLIAYWLGRRHDFYPDDSAGKCLAFR